MEKTIEQLIEDLKNDDDFVVEEAKGLLEMRKEESLDYLIDALKDENKNVRLNAAKILAFIGDSKAIHPLIEALEDNNKLVRREVSTAISRMGAEAVDPLIKILNNSDWRVKGAAAWSLGNMKDKKALPYLKELLDDENGFVRTGAQNAINILEKS